MKRSRSSSRSRGSGNAAELSRLAVGAAKANSSFEEKWWQQALAALIERLLHEGAEDDFIAASDQLYANSEGGYNALLDALEDCSEVSTIRHDGAEFSVVLFAAPFLAWSRYSVPSGAIAESVLQALATQLGAHVMAGKARLALADRMYSPEQLPHNFCDTRELLHELGQAALAGQTVLRDAKTHGETFAMLSDVRYIVGALVVRPGEPVFRWQEKDAGATRSSAFDAWEAQGGANLTPLLTGCAHKILMPDIFYAALKDADRAARPYALRAAVIFIESGMGVAPGKLRVVVGPFFDREIEEYRISFCLPDRDEIIYGAIWPMLGSENEETDTFAEIEEVLRDCGVNDITCLDHHFPMEFCDDCGVPFYLNPDGELVHPDVADHEEDGAAPLLH